MRLSRRDLLVGVAALGLFPQLARASEVEGKDALLSLLEDRKSAATLGGLWMKENAPQPGEVLARLQARLGAAGDAEALRRAVTEDFRTGTVVTIEGWQIAETQAELCALAYFAETGKL